jgi:putative DNA primase/helicase
MPARWGSFGKNAGKPRTLASLIAMAKAANAPRTGLNALPVPLAGSLGRKLLQPLSEALEDNEPPRWLVTSLIEEATFGMLHGPSGAGKSFIVIDLAMHLATGKSEWHGMAIPRSGPVVYLAGEGHAGLRRRLRTWNQHHGGSVTSPFTLGTYAFDLNSPAGEDAAVGAIEALPEVPKLVIVDTLHRFMTGDENSAGDAKTLIDACGRLQSRFGCAVLLVHHTGNNADAQHRARGSSAWRAALDFELSLKQGSGLICLSCQKLKDGAAPADMFFRLVEVEIGGMMDPDGKPVCSAVIESVATPMRRSSADAKLDNAKSDLRRAFMFGGEVLPDGTVYISRKALFDYLTTHKGLAEVSAKAALKPSRGGLIATLTDHQVVCQEGSGWAIADPSIASGVEANFTRTDADMFANMSVQCPFGQNADERTDTDTPL